MDPAQFLEDCPVTVSDDTFAVIDADRAIPNAFATIRDENETTVVVAADEFDEADTRNVESGWKRLTFDADLPFELVGFLAEVSSALADADVPIFVLSAYSTDHVLVKDDDLEMAVGKLEALGCTIERA